MPGQDPSFNFTTAPDSRQLSITSNSSQDGRTNGSVNLSLLLYENSGGNVAALLQVQQPISNTNLTYNDCSFSGSCWHDVTSINQSTLHSYFLPVEYNSSHDSYFHTLVSTGVIDSSTLYESRPGARFSPPFATGASLHVDGRDPGLSVDLLICDNGTQTPSLSSGSPSSRCNNVGYTTYRSWTNASYGFFEARMQYLFKPLQHRKLADSFH